MAAGFLGVGSDRYGSVLLALGMVVGVAIPLVPWVVTRSVAWPLVLAGGAIATASCVALVTRARQGLGLASRSQRSLRDAVPYDPETQYPVIRASICSGERVAGFKDKVTGHFTEVMLLRSAEDERRFKETYQIESLETEY